MSSLHILGIQQNPNTSTRLLLLHKNTQTKNKNYKYIVPKTRKPPQLQLKSANLLTTCVAARYLCSLLSYFICNSWIYMLECCPDHSKLWLNLTPSTLSFDFKSIPKLFKVLITLHGSIHDSLGHLLWYLNPVVLPVQGLGSQTIPPNLFVSGYH